MPSRNEVVYGSGFFKDADGLPKEAKRKLADLIEIIADNAFDHRLHTKPLGPPLKDKYSFRITRDWRVGFKFLSQGRIQLLVADHRDKIYKRMERL